MREKIKVWLTFPQKLIKEPIIWMVGKNFDVITNIRQASVSDEVGIVALEIEGEREELEKAINFLREKEIKVEPVELNIIE